jgi:hypothetical protein
MHTRTYSFKPPRGALAHRRLRAFCYHRGVRTPESLRAFAGRDFARVAALKEETWLAIARERGPEYGVLVAGELWLEARRLRPEGPSARERAADRRHHLRLIEALGKVAPRDR